MNKKRKALHKEATFRFCMLKLNLVFGFGFKFQGEVTKLVNLEAILFIFFIVEFFKLIDCKNS